MNYLIPANSNNGKLIFNIFRPFDLILFSSGVLVSILLIFLISPSSIIFAILCLLPGLICGILVVPVANYHNVLTVLLDLIQFYYNRRNYKWRGWCYQDEYK
ncbi:MAG: hypothetical protein IJ105_03215 [Bacilli bacterium]|nr:hypothetical protein [Bacilli bacterium]